MYFGGVGGSVVGVGRLYGDDGDHFGVKVGKGGGISSWESTFLVQAVRTSSCGAFILYCKAVSTKQLGGKANVSMDLCTRVHLTLVCSMFAQAVCSAGTRRLRKLIQWWGYRTGYRCTVGVHRWCSSLRIPYSCSGTEVLALDRSLCSRSQVPLQV